MALKRVSVVVYMDLPVVPKTDERGVIERLLRDNIGFVYKLSEIVDATKDRVITDGWLDLEPIYADSDKPTCKHYFDEQVST